MGGGGCWWRFGCLKDGVDFMLEEFLNLVRGVGCLGCCGGVLLPIFIRFKEELLEGGPVFVSLRFFTPFFAIPVEQSSALNVIVSPTNQLGVIDNFMTLRSEVLSIFELLEEGFNGSWWIPLLFHTQFVLRLISIINRSICCPDVGHECKWGYLGVTGVFVLEGLDVLVIYGV